MPKTTSIGARADLRARLVTGLTHVFQAMAVLAALAGVAIVALIGASVTMRYFAFAPFRFTEELVGLLMTAAFFLALPFATLRADHVRVLALVSALPDTARVWSGRLAAVLGAAFCLWFLMLCLPWLEFAFDRNIKTEVGRILMYPWMALLPLSMALSLIAFGLAATRNADGKAPGQD